MERIYLKRVFFRMSIVTILYTILSFAIYFIWSSDEEILPYSFRMSLSLIFIIALLLFVEVFPKYKALKDIKRSYNQDVYLIKNTLEMPYKINEAYGRLINYLSGEKYFRIVEANKGDNTILSYMEKSYSEPGNVINIKLEELNDSKTVAKIYIRNLIIQAKDGYGTCLSIYNKLKNNIYELSSNSGQT